MENLNLASTLHNRIAAVCPIIGVSIGVSSDKATWAIEFASDATDAQKAAATTVFADFDATTAPPEIISDRQFYQQLAIQGIITQSEALAAVGPGTLPATLSNLIGQLPVSAQFDAQMKCTGAVQFHRSSALTETLAFMFGWNSATTDKFWTAASLLL